MSTQKQIQETNHKFNRHSVLEREAKKLERKLKRIYKQIQEEVQKEIERDMTFRLPNINLPIWAY